MKIRCGKCSNRASQSIKLPTFETKTGILLFNVQVQGRIMVFVDDTAKQKIEQIMLKESMTPDHFIRVQVVSGGCSGLSYKLDFDDDLKPEDQVFDDNGVKVVTDLRSFLYLCNTTLKFSSGIDGKGFYFDNPNASRTCSCGESFSV